MRPTSPILAALLALAGCASDSTSTRPIPRNPTAEATNTRDSAIPAAASHAPAPSAKTSSGPSASLRDKLTKLQADEKQDEIDLSDFTKDLAKGSK